MRPDPATLAVWSLLLLGLFFAVLSGLLRAIGGLLRWVRHRGALHKPSVRFRYERRFGRG
jgi:hypothetical protein